jgi:hypothetical protein
MQFVANEVFNFVSRARLLLLPMKIAMSFKAKTAAAAAAALTIVCRSQMRQAAISIHQELQS